MPRKPKPKALPENVRQLDTGRYTLQFEVEEDGKIRRLSQSSILRDEPRSYATLDEALEARKRVRDFLSSTTDRNTTVRGFWERWSNEDDWRWGSEHTGRGTDTYVTYHSRTHRFVQRLGDRQIATITPQDVADYMSEEGGRASSHLMAISMFFRDAAKVGLVVSNPAQEMGRDAKKHATARRRRERSKTTPPDKATVTAMLTRTRNGGYPAALYGWLWTGVETGMRGGELDGMRWEHLHGDVYDIQQQLHYRSNTLEDPKHGSFRKVVIPPDLLDFINHQRGNGSPYIWVNSFAGPWRQDARERWWHWCQDGGPTLRSIVGGATMYQATRHHWAWHALNVLKLHVPDIAHLYGHKDGGKTLLEHYADVDGESARDALRAARAAQPVNLSARRRRSA